MRVLPMILLSKVASVHRGEETLGNTYWLWLWLPCAILALLFILVSVYSIPLVLVSPKLLYALLYPLQIVTIAVVIYFGIGVFRSSAKAKSRFWAGVANVVVALGMLGLFRIPLEWLGVGTVS